jgi:polar amino acid transport system substrate-binding protein
LRVADRLRVAAGGALLFAVAVFAVASCSLPRDPEGTLEEARRDGLRAAAVHAPPWIVVDDGVVVGGIEAALVEEVGRALGTRVSWQPMGEHEAMQALESFRLHLVAGALEANSPWRGKVALARPYYRGRARVGVPAGVAPFSELEGARVAVRTGSHLAAALEARGAVPVETADPWASGLPVAAEDWELHARGFRLGPELAEVARVLALPPGENRFLLEVERTLRPLSSGELERHGREAAS